MALGNTIAAPAQLAERVMRPGMTALPCPPFMHASAHWLAFTMLFGGGTVVTLPGGRFDPAATWQLVGSESVNIVVVVGDAMARPLLDELEAHGPRYDVSSLVAVGSGGAVLGAATKRRLAEMLPGRIVADAFGSSETGQLGGSPPADDPYGAPRLHVDEHTDVLDDELRPVAPGSGAVGRLARSGHTPLGYVGDPDKTATTFVARAGRRWALPGDMATVDADGTITVLGRGSLCINTGGEKVFPDEVETVVKSCADVEDAVVVGIPDERFGERVVAVVQARRRSPRRRRRVACRVPGPVGGLQGARPHRRDRHHHPLAHRQGRLPVGQGIRIDGTAWHEVSTRRSDTRHTVRAAHRAVRCSPTSEQRTARRGEPRDGLCLRRPGQAQWRPRNARRGAPGDR